MPTLAQLGDHPLRLAQRIGADQHAALGIGAQRGEQLVDLVAASRDGGRPAAPKVASVTNTSHCDRLERRAGRVGAALVVARDDDPLAAMIEHDLRRSQHMAGGNEADLDLAHPDRLAIADRMPGLRRRSAPSMIASVSGVAHTALMPAARMVGMAVRHQRARGSAPTDRSTHRRASHRCRADAVRSSRRAWPCPL